VPTTLVRLSPPVIAVAAVAVFLVSPALAGADRVRDEGALVSYSSSIPAGASARVQAVYDASGKSEVTLHVWGLQPNTEYGAHAHVNPCGSTGSAAGPHFQNVQDPVTPSVDPAYANPRNEIWLDLVTDESGNGVAQTQVPWQFAPDRRAHSVIIHVEHTHTGPNDSGVAGTRLACLTVGF
jgi:superoxide dismutase, Cu-Zn family